MKVRFYFEVNLSWTLSEFAYFGFPCPLGLVWTWWMANPEITVRPVCTNPRWLRQRASSLPLKLPSQSSASMTLSNCSQSRRRAGIRTRKLWSLDHCRVKRLQIGPNRFNFCIYTREALRGCCSSVGCARCLFSHSLCLGALSSRRTVSDCFFFFLTLNKAQMVVNECWSSPFIITFKHIQVYKSLISQITGKISADMPKYRKHEV